MSGFSELSFSRFSGHSVKQVSEKQSALADDSSQQTSEKNESETEDCFEFQALVLPFLFSFFHIEIAQFSHTISKPIVKEPSSPLYISVCNFRV